jgi:nitric oxide reductase activation protein
MGAAMRHDTEKAVEELYSKGILSYCLTLDPNDDNYVKRIFSMNNYTIVDYVQKQPALFAALTS